MDISGLGSTYMDMITQNAKDKASTSKLDGQWDKDYSNSTDEELLEACQEFEAYFLEQMFKEMAKTIPESEETSSYTTGIKDYFQDSMMQEIASQSTKKEGLGLAQMLYEQMKRNYSV